MSTVSTHLSESLRTLFARFYTSPGEVWEQWIHVPDDVGQNMIGLLGSFIERGLRGERSMELQEYRAYGELGKVASMAPWSELMTVCNGGRTLDMIETIGRTELEYLCQIIADESTAIETAGK